MIAEVAFAFHWPYSELMDMDFDELLEWHAQVVRINEQLKNR